MRLVRDYDMLFACAFTLMSCPSYLLPPLYGRNGNLSIRVIIGNMTLVELIPTSATLFGLARERAQIYPDEHICTFLVDGDVEETWLTCGELDQQARSIAALLQHRVRCGLPLVKCAAIG